eukprot:4986927-Prymnesium_polylepis.2
MLTLRLRCDGGPELDAVGPKALATRASREDSDVTGRCSSTPCFASFLNDWTSLNEPSGPT